ncbi:MAG: hypothetical protein D3924_15520 [Candidatus Electrothrix sp. AR4]|nr:hypothetical protein [Candidatus Electrothrix sp. AR4]
MAEPLLPILRAASDSILTQHAYRRFSQLAASKERMKQILPCLTYGQVFRILLPLFSKDCINQD